MASLHKRKLKSGTGYRIAYRYNHKQYNEYLPAGTTLTRAKAILAEFNRRLIDDKLNVRPFASPLRERSPPITIEQFRNWFLANKKTAIRKRKGSIQGN